MGESLFNKGRPFLSGIVDVSRDIELIGWTLRRILVD